MTALGMVLLVAGALVAVAEAHYPSHGIAGGTGVVAMAIGAVLAISGLGAGLLIGVLAGVALLGAGAGVLAVTVSKASTVRGLRPRAALVGQVGVVRRWDGGEGSVALDGALWRACRSIAIDDVTDEPAGELHPGDPVVVERLSGLTVAVRPAERWELLR